MSGPDPRHDDEHRSWDELAVGWALHALEPEDETVFAAHLTGCTRCARTVAETAEVMAAMAGDLPQAEPSDGLRERLRAAVEETEQLPPTPRRPEPRPQARPEPRPEPRPAARQEPPVPPAPGPDDELFTTPVTPLPASRFGNLRAPLPARDGDLRPAWRRVLPTALVAAAVAAVLSLGAWGVVVSGDRDAARATAAEQSQLLEQLLTPGRAVIAPLESQGRQVATVVAHDDSVQVVASGLPVNDSHDSVYVVWGVDGRVPRALGTFDVVTAGTDVRNVGSVSATGLDQFDGYAISAEPGRQAPSSPTDVVATGQVTS